MLLPERTTSGIHLNHLLLLHPPPPGPHPHSQRYSIDHADAYLWSGRSGGAECCGVGRL